MFIILEVSYVNEQRNSHYIKYEFKFSRPCNTVWYYYTSYRNLKYTNRLRIWPSYLKSCLVKDNKWCVLLTISSNSKWVSYIRLCAVFWALTKFIYSIFTTRKLNILRLFEYWNSWFNFNYFSCCFTIVVNCQFKCGWPSKGSSIRKDRTINYYCKNTINCWAVP